MPLLTRCFGGSSRIASLTPRLRSGALAAFGMFIDIEGAFPQRVTSEVTALVDLTTFDEHDHESGVDCVSVRLSRELNEALSDATDDERAYVEDYVRRVAGSTIGGALHWAVAGAWSAEEDDLRACALICQAWKHRPVASTPAALPRPRPLDAAWKGNGRDVRIAVGDLAGTVTFGDDGPALCPSLRRVCELGGASEVDIIAVASRQAEIAARRNAARAAKVKAARAI